MDAKSLFLTANADTVLLLGVSGPDQGTAGGRDAAGRTRHHQRHVVDWIIDIGFPGPDRGEGGKYLLVPPGYDGHAARRRFLRRALEARTTCSTLGRAFLENNDPKPVDEIVKKSLKIYPYTPGGYGTSIASYLNGKAARAAEQTGQSRASSSRPAARRSTRFPPAITASSRCSTSSCRRSRPTAIDPELPGQLAAIGIVKGKPFNPDARMRKILTDAAAVGNAAGRTL